MALFFIGGATHGVFLLGHVLFQISWRRPLPNRQFFRFLGHNCFLHLGVCIYIYDLSSFTDRFTRSTFVMVTLSNGSSYVEGVHGFKFSTLVRMPRVFMGLT